MLNVGFHSWGRDVVWMAALRTNWEKISRQHHPTLLPASAASIDEADAPATKIPVPFGIFTDIFDESLAQATTRGKRSSLLSMT